MMVVFKIYRYICNHVAKDQTADHVQIGFTRYFQFLIVPVTLPGLPGNVVGRLPFQLFPSGPLARNRLSICGFGPSGSLGISTKDILSGPKISLLAGYFGSFPAYFISWSMVRNDLYLCFRLLAAVRSAYHSLSVAVQMQYVIFCVYCPEFTYLN